MLYQDLLNEGMILIDKPLNWTSFDVVKKTRNILCSYYNVKKIKVGHAGTLDPLATGLLLICSGKFTKRINEFQNLKKEYTGTMFLGATTASFDLETKINNSYSTKHITNEEIKNSCSKFTGKIKQIPPIFSALKKNGKRLYELARENKKINLNHREVTIYEFW